MSSENTLHNPESAPGDEYKAGARSITQRGPSRRDLVKQRRELSLRSRPFIILGAVMLLGLLAVPVYAFIQTYVIPPRQLAVRVGDAEYTRGDVVNFIRFNQRLSEDLGVEFPIGSSLFEALQTIQDNELAYQLAPRFGVTVDEEDVDQRIEFLLGFHAQLDGQQLSPEQQANLAEEKRQFLNRVGLPEEVYRDIIRKGMFKERVRDAVANDVPRIQPQVHLYKIMLTSADPQVLQQIDRALAAGDPVEDVVLEFSKDPDVRRSRGDQGWLPQGVMTRFDEILFGADDTGTRVLPVGEASDPYYETETRAYVVYVVSEFSEAREVSDENFEALADRALTIFLNQERRNYDLWMDVDDKIYAWVNKQVRLASLLPTATPGPIFPGVTPDQLPSP